MSQKDNTTLRRKVSLRQALLAEIETPIVMETHGGTGMIWQWCYRYFAPQGIVIEKDPQKSELLARQRPTWAVYECDSELGIRAGLGSHLPVNFLDCDPYGMPWPLIEAFFASERPFPRVMAVACNDGLRQRLVLGGAWQVKSLAPYVARYGNQHIYPNYLDVCREKMTDVAATRGYKLRKWAGYYCGAHSAMTHYGAIMERSE